ncbi:hypothetical protein [Pseudonocardia sp. WMMC193]|uniref:hypothetical protein n=1 Tax=Pseudonocardia sp. WMMC193 TaxID=2911965 RepID=UPI001F3628C1|nr:hypothetical protein [Pseudonocardia sp. WMMC193]MCF7548893.1 hypothetical protein [Pseudonocardia sp. WMMC193]
MPTTPRYALRYPASSDAPNGPTQLQNLATDVEGWLSPPVAELYTNAVQSVPNATWTSMTLNAEGIDTHNAHSTASNTSRFVAPTGWGGIYQVSGQSYLVQIGDGVMAVRLAKNGVPVRGSIVRVRGAGSGDTDRGLSTAAHFIQLNAGDYVEVQSFHTRGVAADTFTNDEYGPSLSVCWVRAA